MNTIPELLQETIKRLKLVDPPINGTYGGKPKDKYFVYIGEYHIDHVAIDHWGGTTRICNITTIEHLNNFCKKHKIYF